MQSMVRDEGARAILFDMDQSIQSLAANLGHRHDDVIRLTGAYHNLVRRWADT
jgi:PKHD-type hydroxylase